VLFGFDDPAETDPVAPGDSGPEPELRPENRRSWHYVALGLCAGAAIVLAAWALWPTSTELTRAEVDGAIADALSAQENETPAAAAFDQIASSIVIVRARSADGGDVVGAGFVFNASGQVLTASHLINQASTIELEFADGSRSIAEIASVDLEVDTAVLTALAPSLQLVPAVVGNSRTLAVGDPVFAVGNPIGLTASLSAGIVSGLDRRLEVDPNTGQALEGLIQFDAAVNRGSAGGPLLNEQGHVIGLVTVLAAPPGTGSIAGFGFAVPIDVAVARSADRPSQ